MKIEEMSYEAAREELVEVVKRLESGGVSLAESMELWKRGDALANRCQEHLDAAKKQVAESQPINQ